MPFHPAAWCQCRRQTCRVRCPARHLRSTACLVNAPCVPSLRSPQCCLARLPVRPRPGGCPAAAKASAAEAMSRSLLGESEVTLGAPAAWAPAPRTPPAWCRLLPPGRGGHPSLRRVLRLVSAPAPAAMGLAALEVMHAVQRTWANAKVRTGGRTRPMQWRDMFDIAVKWRR